MTFLLFFLGAAVGSFLGLISDRYREDLPLWDKKIIGGRSHCEFCKKQLRWFELVPVISFLIQAGKCRSCRHRLGLRYLFFEITSGLVFISVPCVLSQYFYVINYTFYILSALWISIFSILFLVSLIDYRLRIIPDEANLMLVLPGALITFFQPFNDISGSFLGHYAMLFGWRSNPWINHLMAAAIVGLFFAAIIFATRGRGMGGGDMKLAAAMGFVFGWPDIILSLILAFIFGSIFGAMEITLGKKGLKSKVPFGPFLAFSGLVVFMFGYQIIDWYFGLFAR